VGAHNEIGPVLADPVRRAPPALHETIAQMDLLQLVADPQIPLLPRGPQELRRPLVGILPREIDSLAAIAPALRRPSAAEGTGAREVSLHPFGGVLDGFACLPGTLLLLPVPFRLALVL